MRAGRRSSPRPDRRRSRPATGPPPRPTAQEAGDPEPAQLEQHGVDGVPHRVVQDVEGLSTSEWSTRTDAISSPVSVAPKGAPYLVGSARFRRPSRLGEARARAAGQLGTRKLPTTAPVRPSESVNGRHRPRRPTRRGPSRAAREDDVAGRSTYVAIASASDCEGPVGLSVDRSRTIIPSWPRTPQQGLDWPIPVRKLPSPKTTQRPLTCSIGWTTWAWWPTMASTAPLAVISSAHRRWLDATVLEPSLPQCIDTTTKRAPSWRAWRASATMRAGSMRSSATADPSAAAGR